MWPFGITRRVRIATVEWPLNSLPKCSVTAKNSGQIHQPERASTANYKFIPTRASFCQVFFVVLVSRQVRGRGAGVFRVGRPV